MTNGGEHLNNNADPTPLLAKALKKILTQQKLI
jgi:hypothetical protein